MIGAQAGRRAVEGACALDGEPGDGDVRAPGPGGVHDDPGDTQQTVQWRALGVDVLHANVRRIPDNRIEPGPSELLSVTIEEDLGIFQFPVEELEKMPERSLITTYPSE